MDMAMSALLRQGMTEVFRDSFDDVLCYARSQ